MSPCQSRWSWLRFSTVAAAGSKPSTASSWKLDSSITHTSGSGVSAASSALPSVSSKVGPDVAGGGHALAGAFDQQRGQRGGGGLAVGAGDGQQLRGVAALGLQVGECGHEQIEFALHHRAARARGRQQRCDAVVGRRQARALQHALHLVQHRHVERAAAQRHRGQRGVQRRGHRRRIVAAHARIPHPHRRTLARTPRRHRQPGVTEPEHQHRLTLQRAHRSFRLARPIRHSSMVMIQKRTTTCVSVQPDFSK